LNGGNKAERRKKSGQESTREIQGSKVEAMKKNVERRIE